MVFLVSGILHQISDMARGCEMSEAGSLVFFCCHPLGIMIEDAVQDVTKGWGIPPRVRRLVGYVWVFAWFWWWTPVWFYPMVRQEKEASLVPFSIAKRVLGQ